MSTKKTSLNHAGLEIPVEYVTIPEYLKKYFVARVIGITPLDFDPGSIGGNCGSTCVRDARIRLLRKGPSFQGGRPSALGTRQPTYKQVILASLLGVQGFPQPSKFPISNLFMSAGVDFATEKKLTDRFRSQEDSIHFQDVRYMMRKKGMYRMYICNIPKNKQRYAVLVSFNVPSINISHAMRDIKERATTIMTWTVTKPPKGY